QLGADVAIDYTTTKFEEVAKDVDVVLDSVGKDTLARSYGVVKKGGFVATLVAQPDQSELDKHGIRGASISVKPTANELAEITKLVSSMAVVLSVLYLGLQVHRSTRVAKLAAQDAAATALRDVTKPFMENAELGEVWRVGLENLDTLSPGNQARFFHATYQFLKAFETIHFHYAYGLLDQQLWEGWRELL